MNKGIVNKIMYFSLNRSNVFIKQTYSIYRNITHHKTKICTDLSNLTNYSNKRYFNDNSDNDLTIDWEHSEDITDLLFEEYKNVDPLTLRFEELENMIIDTVVNKNQKKLSGRCNEGILENIQMDWLERYNNENA
ncbi:iron-sulfur assembly protein, putative [Plasmodium berghei]|uniref:Fe-S assembly protein IscX, putative n=2 Tax=Plasmodium berghei TaxID=5821 RepID=A0A509AMG1_PLABA|nr:Fe-S assembly protein IscX, putative [Plasmodium berghei ANKA]CXI68101.1 iron-sulfur assembly protein, putative [Plasmodium berghei]SCM24179.1 iron-sulfur assembly protein, putative [Plasmodium berghei]SCN26966.1 iron-sulfur assembly protein, putative [Plasmodium berghei]SCO61410.1 iron-sulfur assembly protein, putative [Plasmodium berghei]SCO63387.1 iron-sulfur assembly protein, putative [Plasmodium berghei]|eukprot:XP_034422582.1 Fe-S assembly protein IscX, putative [Plasmodium berghei ANKA]